jgi:hypothetical protein
MGDLREWTTKFFPEELMTVDSSAVAADQTTDWTGRGKVLWTRGIESNELNPRLTTGMLQQPEDIKPIFDKKDEVTWTLFIPSTVLAKARAKGSPPLPPIPVTLLLGRGDEELGYGLRLFFERAGTGALLCLSGREREDTIKVDGTKLKAGRWNVGISQKTIEKIFTVLGFKNVPQVQVLAGYSTGYGVVQTINNELVPLAPVKRLVFFDCIYRTDQPRLPKGESGPKLAKGDLPEFSGPLPGQVILDEGKGPFRDRPFNTRRAITRLTGASNKCVIAAYSATAGGSPRYGVWRKDTMKLVVLGKQPVVEIPNLAEMRDDKASAGSPWSPSDAYDALILCRYLELGTKAGLIKATDPPKVYQDIISKGLPGRGTVFSSAAIKRLVTVPPALATTPVELITWVKGLSQKPSGKERESAAKLVRQHELVLPGWRYPFTDLAEYRHAGCLSEFGWELLPP